MRRLRERLPPLAIALLVLDCSACPKSAAVATDVPPTAVSSPERLDIAENIYDDGLKNGWQDWGWAPRDVGLERGPARVRFTDNGGWIIAKPGLTGTFGGVVFRIKAPPGEAEFLEVRVESNGANVFPRIKVSPDHRTDVGDGWTQVFISMSELDPEGLPFDRVILRAFRNVNVEVLLDKIALIKGMGLASPDASYDPATLPRINVAIDCHAKSTRISPYIYGIAFYPFNDDKTQAAQWLVKGTVRRWGGNPTSTYNWEISSWNSGNDWFFENLNTPSHTEFLHEDAAHAMASTLTVPIMGWVSKDKTSSSFPVSVLGPQQATDQWRPDAGNGKAPGGGLVKPGPPTLAYRAATPAFVKAWVEAIRKQDAVTGKRSVYSYILDNEPGSWNTTHRDAHPTPLSFDELVQRSIDYGTAIREADPDAIIAGPAEWGWTGFMYSGKDLAQGGPLIRPDRRAHGDMPLVAYYLKALADHEKKTGVHILDVFDLHGYPAAESVAGDNDEPDAAALRIRSTRMLWDPNYVDESWIKEPVKLLPRMRDWIAENYPGRGISIGEWNYGGEKHMSGGLAIAEVLGRYAQFGVTSAYYWVYPPEDSPGMWAFRAYRDFDGKGGHFLDWYSPTTNVENASVFASRDDAGTHLVAVVLNFSKENAVTAKLDLSSCGVVGAYRSYAFAGAPTGFTASGPPVNPHQAVLSQALPPYSITVLDIELENAAPVVK